jgi:hypothetical protein
MRWISLLAAVFGFAVAFASKTAGMMAFGLLLGFGCLFTALFAFAAARIASTARPDAALLTDRDISLLRASLRKPGANPAQSSPNLPSANNS